MHLCCMFQLYCSFGVWLYDTTCYTSREPATNFVGFPPWKILNARLTVQPCLTIELSECMFGGYRVVGSSHVFGQAPPRYYPTCWSLLDALFSR